LKDDEKWNLKMDNVKTIEKPADNRHPLLSPLKQTNEHGKEYNNHEENNATGSWLTSPESTASASTSSSKQQNADVSTSVQFEYRARESGDLEYACPSLEMMANERETWDELRTIETTGSDTFDLLSYLWDVSRSTVQTFSRQSRVFGDQFFILATNSHVAG